jgi:type IV secretion system protein VirD4
LRREINFPCRHKSGSHKLAIMSATRILWGQILIVCAIVLATIWSATQWTAWRLAFQPELGLPWFLVGTYRLYHPPAFFWWWYHFDAYAPEIFVEGAVIAASGGFASIAVAIGMSVHRAREAKNVVTYGSARWATAEEVRQAGLVEPDGVLLGKFEHKYLRHDGPEHVLCFAPTRSGKGVGLVVPTLLTWPGSVIVHDIKGENWSLTAGWRARFGRVLLFDPTNASSSAYNPLLEVRRGPQKSETSRTSLIFSLTRKGHLSGATIGKRPVTLFSSAQFFMFFTPKPTRPSPASPTSCLIRSAPSRPLCAP